MKTILSSETMDIPDGVTVKVKAKVIEVEGPRGKLTRNFKHLNLDFERVPKVEMLDGVTITRSEKVKDELVLDGNDIELVSRSAALINQKCHVKNKDIRKFLDGIYVSERSTIATGDD